MQGRGFEFKFRLEFWQASGKLFKRLNPEGPEEPVVWVLMPALGGLCTGAVALAFPEIPLPGLRQCQCPAGAQV